MCSDDGEAGHAIDLGGGRTLWAGEISRALFDEHGLGDHFESDGGWWLVDFDGPNGTRVLARCLDRYSASDLLGIAAAGIRAVDARTPAI